MVNEARIVTPSIVGGKSLYYSNVMFPTDDANMETLTVNYYDDYNWNAPLNPSDDGITQIFNQDITNLTQGKPTGGEVKVLDTNFWIRRASFYDDKGRVIQSSLQNDYLAITEMVQYEIDFIGNIVKAETRHAKRDQSCTDGGGLGGFPICTDHFQYITTLDEFTYDIQNRRLTHTQTQKDQDNNVIGIPELIMSNTYDELGLLVQKNVGGAVTNSTPLQQMDYAYNVRGWLKQINDPESSLTNDVFAFKINYNTVTTNPNNGNLRLNSEALFNGNISETIWRTASDDIKRGYGYQYDKLDRINRARYKAGDELNQDARFYDLSNVRYDKNGNITRLRRRAPLADFSDHENIDQLNYRYFNNSNQLRRVNDNYAGTNTDGFIDGDNIDNDYAYDDNGNLILDKNKNITNIEYNFLNLPTRVVFSQAGEINPTVNFQQVLYKYDATGIKIEKRIEDIGVVLNGEIIEYCENFVYKRQIANGQEDDYSILEFFMHPEGFVEPIVGESLPPVTIGFNYVYQCKDHLGNIRASISDFDKDGHIDILRNGVDIDGDNGVPQFDNEIIQTKNYYPFGVEHNYGNASPLSLISGRDHIFQTYQGQEFTKEFGLNWHEWKYRMSSPELGRFWQIDPLSEDYYFNSTYAFSENRIVDSVELEGLERVFAADGKFVGAIGDSQEIRVANGAGSNAQLKSFIDASNNSELTQEERDSARNIVMENSFHGYATKKDAATDLGWRYTRASGDLDREFGAALYDVSLSNDEGGNIEGSTNNTVTILGPTAVGEVGADNIGWDQLMKGFTIYVLGMEVEINMPGTLSGIMHTHPNGAMFSTGGGALFGSDEITSIHFNVPIYMSNQKKNLYRADFHLGSKKEHLLTSRVNYAPVGEGKVGFIQDEWGFWED